MCECEAFYILSIAFELSIGEMLTPPPPKFLSIVLGSRKNPERNLPRERAPTRFYVSLSLSRFVSLEANFLPASARYSLGDSGDK